MENTEVWKEIIGYEGLYKVSNLGKVKSLKFNKERILKGGLDSSGYLQVALSKNGIIEVIQIHILVAIYFLNHIRDGGITQVDHKKEGNKLDNRVENLQILAQRNNIIKYRKTLKSSSQYIGVCWSKKSKKWTSSITLNGKKKHLGLFVNEIDAHNAYQNQLNQINNI